MSFLHQLDFLSRSLIITYYFTDLFLRRIKCNSIHKSLLMLSKDLRVKLYYKGIAIPLPTWFKDINRYKTTNVSILENFFSYMHNVAEKIPTTILDEIKRVVCCKPQGRPIYSPEVLRFSLMQRYT